MGRNYCCLCGKSSGIGGCHRNFFLVPYDNSIRLSQWEAITRRKFVKGVDLHVCSDHFDKSSFDPAYLEAKALYGDECKKRAKLTPDSVPLPFEVKSSAENHPGKVKAIGATTEAKSGCSETSSKATKKPEAGSKRRQIIQDSSETTCDSKKSKYVPNILRRKQTANDGLGSNCNPPFCQSTPKKAAVGGVCMFEETSPIATYNKGETDTREESHESLDSSTDDKEDERDLDYEPSATLPPGDTTADFSQEFDELDPNESMFRDEEVTSMKYMFVEISKVEELLKECKECKEENKIKRCRTGASFTFYCECPQGHKTVWQSSSRKGKKPVINILLVAAIFCSGLGYTAFKRFADSASFAFMGHTTFYKHLADFVSPVILNDWVKMRREILVEMLAANWKAILSGDARFDSPGHCAKYALYSIMCNVTGRVIDFIVWQQGLEPGELESKAFDFVFQRVVDTLGKSKVSIFCSDRNLSVAKKMREKYDYIKHQYDIWHLSKSVGKSLTIVSKKFKEIAAWIPAIRNHLWYCSETCKRDEKVLLQKWASMVKHVQGKHKWKEGKKWVKCDHAPLSEEEQESKDWIDSRPAIAALTKATQNTRFLNQLKKCSEFVHTGNLESFHNVCLLYAPKRISYSYQGMVLRSILAAMDNNYNVGRKVEGSDIHYSKASKGYVLNDRYASKSGVWRLELVEKVVEAVDNPDLLTEDPADIMNLLFPFCLPDNIAPVEKPSKEELLEKRQSRVRKHKK